MNVESESRRSACPTCGAQFDRPIILFEGKELFAHAQRECPGCSQARKLRLLKIDNEEEKRRIDEPWLRFCPPLYQDFNLDRLPIERALARKVLRYRPSKKTGRGLGLVGPSRIGKRRLLFGLARDLFTAGVRLGHTSAIDFARLTSEQYDYEIREVATRARQKLAAVRTIEVLIVSDIGMGKLTDRGQLEFYSLVEHRAMFRLPILWTTAFSAEQLAAKFKSERDGNAVAQQLGRRALARLSECSDVIRVEREPFSTASAPAAAATA